MKTINLENAKRLQELVVERDSLCWYSGDSPRMWFQKPVGCVDYSPIPYHRYTADEIGDMLGTHEYSFRN